MKNNSDFLFEKVVNHDVVMAQILSSPSPQTLRVRIEKIYSSGKAIDFESLGHELEFIHSPNHWGNEILKPGERAIVFLTLISGRLYEDASRGHLLLEFIDNDLYAIYPSRELWLSTSIPDVLRNSSRQDPIRQNSTAIGFDVFESYLMKIIDATSS